MKSYIQRIAVLVPIVVLVGCAMSSISMRERLLRDGYPPAYAEGFEAGYSCGFDYSFLCSQASAEFDSLINKEGGKTINMDAHRHRYAEDRSYAQGWDDGKINRERVILDELNQAKFSSDNSYLQQELLKRNDD